MTIGTREDELLSRARNHYQEDEYFRSNIRAGVIRNPIGTRIVALPEEFLLGLHRGLVDETGEAAPVVLHAAGRWWGKQLARRHDVELRQLYGQDAGELSTTFYLQVLRRIWAMHGWGRLDLDFALESKGIIRVTLANSLFATVAGVSDKPVDHLLAGVLGSLVGHLAGRDLEAVEIACTSRGDQQCVFLVGIKARVLVLTGWVRQGRTPAQILEAIQAGELL